MAGNLIDDPSHPKASAAGRLNATAEVIVSFVIVTVMMGFLPCGLTSSVVNGCLAAVRTLLNAMQGILRSA